MRAARIIGRGVLFVGVAGAAYTTSMLFALFVLGKVCEPETVVNMLVAPSWVDIVATASAAGLVNALPSSRLRVLPVWLACAGLTVGRVYLMGEFLSAFAFGPGAYPIDVTEETIRIFLAPPGLLILTALILVGLLASTRRAPISPDRARRSTA